jgi:hypothetical protein
MFSHYLVTSGCYLCVAPWKTCTCRQWDNDRPGRERTNLRLLGGGFMDITILDWNLPITRKTKPVGVLCMAFAEYPNRF